jgi:hypothetical protein
MRVSFDMDGTLTCCEESLLTERQTPWFVRPWFKERLRAGTTFLLKELIHRGCDVWIYTTSDRNSIYLKLWFRTFLGVPIGGVINQEIHNRVVTRFQPFATRVPSKYPPAFGIDLHVDDSPGVAMEGDLYGFDVLLIAQDDAKWTGRILAEVDMRLSRARTRRQKVP